VSEIFHFISFLRKKMERKENLDLSDFAKARKNEIFRISESDLPLPGIKKFINPVISVTAHAIMVVTI